MTKLIEADIAIVGAGLVGLSAAVACAKQGKKVVIVDSKKLNTKLKKVQPKKTWDARVYALTNNTVAWLQTVGVMADVDASRVNAINTMHLWDVQENKLALHDSDANLASLGMIIENQNLLHALWQQVDALGVTVVTDSACAYLENTNEYALLGLADGQSIKAKLVVAADGVDSWVRKHANIAVKQKDFNQTAIVANFKVEKPHQNIARQWFAPHETLALLPLPQQMVSMVWALSTERATELLTLTNEALAAEVETRSKADLGSLSTVGKELSFRLMQQTAIELIAERIILVGDAAHHIHPMAGQGMNLGLRDVRQLHEMLTNTHALQDIGETTFLRQYERARRADIATMNTLTSGLDALFANESSMAKNIAGWGLKQLNRQSTLKKLLIQQAA